MSAADLVDGERLLLEAIGRAQHVIEEVAGAPALVRGDEGVVPMDRAARVAWRLLEDALIEFGKLHPSCDYCGEYMQAGVCPSAECAAEMA